MMTLSQMTEKQRQNGSLEEIDALLACGALSFPRSLLANFHHLSSHSKDVICTQLLLLMNWFREVWYCIFMCGISDSSIGIGRS
jgi:hypothetical protein